MWGRDSSSVSVSSCSGASRAPAAIVGYQLQAPLREARRHVRGLATTPVFNFDCVYKARMTSEFLTDVSMAILSCPVESSPAKTVLHPHSGSEARMFQERAASLKVAVTRCGVQGCATEHVPRFHVHEALFL